MGSSMRKKREKKRDFNVRYRKSFQSQEHKLIDASWKAKLKVGREKAKAANFTDTSFKSKCTSLHVPRSTIHVLIHRSHSHQSRSPHIGRHRLGRTIQAESINVYLGEV